MAFPPPLEPRMHRFTLPGRFARHLALVVPCACALALLVACGEQGPQGPGGPGAGSAAGAPAKPALDHTSPKALVLSFFAIAKAGDLKDLAGLAAPTGADGDAREIAGSGSGKPEMQQRVKQAFGPAQIVGEPEESGDSAKVNILFGPEGKQKKETLVLIRLDGKWYLQGL